MPPFFLKILVIILGIFAILKQESWASEKISASSQPLLLGKPLAFTEEISQAATQSRLKKESIRQQEQSFTTAQQVLLNLTKESLHSSTHYPLLKKYLLDTAWEKHTKDMEDILPRSLVSMTFMGAQSKDDFIHAMIRIASSIVNLPKEADTKMRGEGNLYKERSLFAGECYLLAARHLEMTINPLFKDLLRLPHHRHHPEESSHLTSSHGKKIALDASASLVQLYGWALFRLAKEDPRRDLIHQHLTSFSKTYTHYYKTHVSHAPTFDEILSTSPLIKATASLMHFNQNHLLEEHELRSYLFSAANDLYSGMLSYKTKPTLVFWKNSKNPLMPKDFARILRTLITLHTNEFVYYTLPQYQQTHKRIQKMMDDSLPQKKEKI